MSYLPKATVQAAIGSVPLAMGFPCGQIVLSVAVVGIFFTSFIGTIAIDSSYQKLLEKELTGKTYKRFALAALICWHGSYAVL